MPKSKPPRKRKNQDRSNEQRQRQTNQTLKRIREMMNAHEKLEELEKDVKPT